MWLFVCSDGNPKAQHWPATAVYNLPHIYWESQRPNDPKARECIIDLSAVSKQLSRILIYTGYQVQIGRNKTEK